jgi:hypothetical protein
VAPLVILLLLTGTARAVEPDWPTSPRTEDEEAPLSFSLSNRAGLAKAPFVTRHFPQVSGFAMVLTPAAAFRVASLGRLHLKLPISIVRLDFPARAQVAESTPGNLELGLRRQHELSASTRLGFGAAFVVPSADHGSEASLLENRALSLGSALNGGKDALLLTPGVSGARLEVSVETRLRAFDFRAGLDLPLLVRVSNASLPEETDTHVIGISPTIDLRAAFWIKPWLATSLGGSLIMEPWRVQEPALERDRKRRLQPMVEPGLQVRLGAHVVLGLDASVPLGGSLGGDAFGVGLHAQVDL